MNLNRYLKVIIFFSTQFFLLANLFASSASETMLSKISKEDENDLKKGAYVIGYNEAIFFREMRYKINEKSILQGMNEGFFNKIKSPKLVKNKKIIVNNYVNRLSKKLTLKQIRDFSYLIGLDFGRDFANKFFPFYPKDFIKGIMDSLKNKKSLYSLDDTSITYQFFKQSDHLRENYNNSQQMFTVSNEKLKKINNNIQYQVIKEGQGKVLVLDDSYEKITLHIILKDSQGSIVMETPKEGTEYKMADIYPIVKECLSIMKEGSQILFYFPAKFLKKDSKNPNNRVSFNLTLVKATKRQ